MFLDISIPKEEMQSPQSHPHARLLVPLSGTGRDCGAHYIHYIDKKAKAQNNLTNEKHSPNTALSIVHVTPPRGSFLGLFILFCLTVLLCFSSPTRKGRPDWLTATQVWATWKLLDMNIIGNEGKDVDSNPSCPAVNCRGNLSSSGKPESFKSAGKNSEIRSIYKSIRKKIKTLIKKSANEMSKWFIREIHRANIQQIKFQCQ